MVFFECRTDLLEGRKGKAPDGKAKTRMAIWDKEDDAWKRRRRHHWKKLLRHDGVERIIKQARKEALERGSVGEVETALGYFVNNVARKQYGTFRAKKYFIGSGVIEAGCRTVIGKRCKQSGMFWGEPGADKVLAFRCPAPAGPADAWTRSGNTASTHAPQKTTACLSPHDRRFLACPQCVQAQNKPKTSRLFFSLSVGTTFRTQPFKSHV